MVYENTGQWTLTRGGRILVAGAVGVVAVLCVAAPGAADPLPRRGTVTVGGLHACSTVAGDGTYCWGYNAYGQLGNATTADQTTPVPVTTPAGVTFSNLVAGFDHTCASGSDAKVYCWGYNRGGQLGNGNTTDQTVPVPVSKPAGVTFTHLAAAGNHTCAQGSDDKVYCWGANNKGELGNGSTVQSSVPVAVSAAPGVILTKPTVGYRHTCAQGSDTTMYCWGDNTKGQLGTGGTTDSHVPVAVSVPAGVTLTNPTAGASHTCAQGSDTKVYCWGDNTSGELGDGTTTDSHVPVAVVAPSGVTLTGPDAGSGHTCAQGSDTQVYCWGFNNRGQLGDATTNNHNTPVPVPAPPGVTLTKPSAGGATTCALASTGTTYCWGYGLFGQLGTGATSDSGKPVLVTSLPLPPTGLSATAEPHAVTVTWQSQTDLGSGALTHYTATAASGGASCTTTTTTCTMAGLAAATRYTITVTTNTAVGPSGPSEPVTAITLSGPILPTGDVGSLPVVAGPGSLPVTNTTGTRLRATTLAMVGMLVLLCGIATVRATRRRRDT